MEAKKEWSVLTLDSPVGSNRRDGQFHYGTVQLEVKKRWSEVSYNSQIHIIGQSGQK